MATMRAAVFQGKGKNGIHEVPWPVPGVGEALVRITPTTLCGTDAHILRGEHAARSKRPTTFSPTSATAP
jgi:alcohol dehydrogenase